MEHLKSKNLKKIPWGGARLDRPSQNLVYYSHLRPQKLTKIEAFFQFFFFFF